MGFLKGLLLYMAFFVVIRWLISKIRAHTNKKEVAHQGPLTIEIIEQNADKNLLQLVFENLTEKIAPGTEREYEAVRSLTKSQQAIFITWLLDKEIYTGGFQHFYESSNAQYAPIAPAALELIGAVQLARLVNQANAIFKLEKEEPVAPQDGKSKTELFSELDEDFYDLCARENLIQLQIDFIRTHQSEFIDH